MPETEKQRPSQKQLEVIKRQPTQVSDPRVTNKNASPTKTADTAKSTMNKSASQAQIASPKQTIKSKSKRGRIVFQSHELVDKEELKLVKEELENLKVDELELNDEDDRDYMITRLNDVNNKLIEKLERLEQVVEQTVQKAYEATKRNFSSHREWENDLDDDTKDKSKQIQQIHAQVNTHKKTIA